MSAETQRRRSSKKSRFLLLQASALVPLLHVRPRVTQFHVQRIVGTSPLMNGVRLEPPSLKSCRLKRGGMFLPALDLISVLSASVLKSTSVKHLSSTPYVMFLLTKPEKQDITTFDPLFCAEWCL